MIVSRPLYPGLGSNIKQNGNALFQKTTINLTVCRSLCISGPGDTEVTATGQVSLRVARPDSPAQSNISRVPSRGDGARVGRENGRLVKWGMPGSGWSGVTRKGEEPGAFYHPGTDSFPFWLLHNHENAIWKGFKLKNWTFDDFFSELCWT